MKRDKKWGKKGNQRQGNPRCLQKTYKNEREKRQRKQDYKRRIFKARCGL